MANITSIVSVIVSAVVSIMTLILLWWEKQYTFHHINKLNEYKDVSESIVNVMTIMAPSGLCIYYKRTAALNVSESFEEFSIVIEKYNFQVNQMIYRLCALKETNEEMTNKLQGLQSKNRKCIIEINDLKALVSSKDNSIQMKEYINRSCVYIEECIRDYAEMYEMVKNELINILIKGKKKIR